MLGTFNGECHLGWETNGDYCYYAFKSSASFVYNEARSSCLAENATLTSVENREEQLFLNGKYLFCQNHWIHIILSRQSGKLIMSIQVTSL